MIESCENTDKHDEHYWQPNPILRASSWCPGAAGQPKPIKATWIVVVDEPYESINAIYHADAKESAEALAAGLNAIFTKQNSGLKAEAWEAMKPPEVDDTSSAKVKSEAPSRLLSDEIAIDLEKIVAALR